MRWTSSPSAPRLAVPLALVLAESAWASLLLNAAFDTAGGPRVQIGFLTLAVPATVAVVLGTAVPLVSPRRSRRHRRFRMAALALAVVAGAMVSAGVIAELARSDSFWQVASHPWAASGHRAATVAGTSWFLSVLAWARGTWLGVAPPSSTHAAWSVALGALAFLGVFAGRADAHAVAFRAATGSAGWLLFLAFPCAVASLALIRQGELQEEVAPGARRGPDPVWLSVLAVPMLAVALVALLVAVTVGPAAPVVGRGVARAARAVWWVVAEVATALWRLFPRTRAHAVHHAAQRGAVPRITLPRPHATTAAAGAVPLALEVALGVVALVLVVLAIRALRPVRRLRGGMRGRAAEGETDSVFSWGHLASQLWQALGRLFTRRPGRPAVAPAVPASRAEGDDLGTIRLAYRRVLTAAHAGGWPRVASETTRELERRLAAGPAAAQAGALAELTSLYDAVRYGERGSGEPEGTTAVARADAVRGALADSAQAAGHG